LVTGENKYLQVWHAKKLESGPWRIEAEGRIILQFISVFVKIIWNESTRAQMPYADFAMQSGWLRLSEDSLFSWFNIYLDRLRIR
jgi:hypothetical protein